MSPSEGIAKPISLTLTVEQALYVVKLYVQFATAPALGTKIKRATIKTNKGTLFATTLPIEENIFFIMQN